MFTLLTVIDHRCNPDPLLEELITGIRLVQMWNVPHLFYYSLNYFKYQFDTKAIQPMIALAITQENGIPSLIRPAIEALAELKVLLYSWCSDNSAFQYTGVKEVSAITRPKEHLYLTHLSLLGLPPATHSKCCVDVAKHRAGWEQYWNVEVTKKVWKLVDGLVSNELWLI